MHKVRDGLVIVEDAIAYATDVHDFKPALDTSAPIPARSE